MEIDSSFLVIVLSINKFKTNLTCLAYSPTLKKEISVVFSIKSIQINDVYLIKQYKLEKNQYILLESVLVSRSKILLPFTKKSLILEKTREKYKYLFHRFFQKTRKCFESFSSLKKKLFILLDKDGFNFCDTPILTRENSLEGSKLFAADGYNHQKYFLSQSPQPFKQMIVSSGVLKYFQFAKCFRFENLRQNRHPEFTQLDIEFATFSLEEIIGYAKKIIRFSSNFLKKQIMFKEYSFEEYKEKFFFEKLDFRFHFKLKKMAKKVKLSFKIIQKIEKSTLNNILEKIKEIAPSNKLFFSNGWLHLFLEPIFECNIRPIFDLLKNNIKKKKKEQCIIISLYPRLKTSPFIETNKKNENYSNSFDFILNGVEIISGGKRELDANRFKNLLSNPSSELQYFLNFLNLAPIPHGGFALGLERLFLSLGLVDSIREIIFFPKSKTGFSYIEDL